MLKQVNPSLAEHGKSMAASSKPTPAKRMKNQQNKIRRKKKTKD